MSRDRLGEEEDGKVSFLVLACSRIDVAKRAKRGEKKRKKQDYEMEIPGCGQAAIVEKGVSCRHGATPGLVEAHWIRWCEARVNAVQLGSVKQR